MNATVLPSIDTSVKLPGKTEAVCRQVGLGFPVKTVAWMFGLSPRTVERFVLLGKARTGARSNVELSLYFVCRELNAKLIMVDGKRKIIALLFLILVAFSEVSTLTSNARAIRSQARTAQTVRASRSKKNELDNYIDYLLEL